jgi:hypothetical protein
VTRAIGIGLAIAAALAAVVAGAVFLLPRSTARRPPPRPEAPLAESLRVRVLAGESGDRAIVVKPRFAEPQRAGFADRALSKTLGVPEGAWRFVEVWVVNRGPGSIRSLEAPLVLRARDGAPIEARSLRALLPSGQAASGRAAMMAHALSPDPAEPLRKGALRQTVYAVPASADFESLGAAEIDGIRLEPRETTQEAIEAMVERPPRDLIAALSRPDDAAETRTGADTANEDSR